MNIDNSVLPYIWLAVFIILLICEVLTTTLVCIWFCLGSLVALLFSAFDLGIYTQVFAFLISSAIFLILTRPIVKRKLENKYVATNIDEIIGKTGIVVEEINNIKATGQVKIGGIIWRAVSNNDEILKKDEIVIVEQIKGVKAMVKRV